MKKLEQIKRYPLWLSYVVFAIFYFWLAAQVPYTHDDWDWGLNIGLQQLVTGNINGRYAGNFIEVIMTRSEFLKTLIMGAGYFLIPFTISRIVRNHSQDTCSNKEAVYFIICNVLMLIIKRAIWQQTNGWVAGFANFSISALFLLMIIKESLCVFDDIDLTKNHFNAKCIGFLFLGLISKLFLENIAIFLVVFTTFINFIYYKRTHRISITHLFLMLGTIVGIVIMFSSSIFQQLWATGEAVGGYRHVHINANASIISMVRSCCIAAANLLIDVMERSILICEFILMLLSIALLALFKHKKRLVTVCICINSCFIAYRAGHYYFGILNNFRFHLGASIMYVLAVMGELIVLFRDSKRLLYKLLAVGSSVIAVILPLCVTTEKGPRLFFTSHVLLVLLAIMLLAFLIDRIPKRIYRCGVLCSITVAVILVAFYGKVYYEIGECKDQRNAIIAQAIESDTKVIVLPNYPHGDFLWLPNPTSESREGYFKEFYGIPQDFTLIFEE